MKEEAFREFTCAKDNFIRLTDSTAVAFLDLHIAQCYLYKEDYIIAKDWLVKTLKNSYARDYVLRDVYFEMAKVETYTSRNYSKALEYINNSIHYTSDKRRLAGTYAQKAVLFQERGQLDSAWHYYHCSLECYPVHTTRAFNYKQMILLAPLLGKVDSISTFIQRHDIYLDSIYIVSNQQAIRQVTNDHRVEMKQRRLEEQHRRLLFIGTTLFFILCLVLLVLYFYHRNKNSRKTIALQNAIRQSNVVLMNLVVPSAEDDELTAVSLESLKNPDAYISLFRLGCHLLDPKAMADMKKLTVVSRGAEADAIRRKITDALDQAFVELMTVLKMVSPSLNKHDLQYIVSRMLGLDDKQIQVIQDTYDSTFRMRRNRLNKKLPAELRVKLLEPVVPLGN